MLGNENRVTSESIGKLQAEIGDRKTNRSENYWEYQRKCPETYNAIKFSTRLLLFLQMLNYRIELLLRWPKDL